MPPAASWASVEATRPCTWNSGMAQYGNVVRPARSGSRSTGPDAVRLRCRSGTCFGRDVVPLVCRSSADVVGAAVLEGRGRQRPPVQLKPRRLARSAGYQFDDRQPVCRSACRGRRACPDHQELRRKVLQVEAVLGLGVRGVERCHGRTESGEREQELNDLRPILQDDGDPVSATNARRTQP